METVKAMRTALARKVVQSARENDGCPGEADETINNASRRVVQAMADEHGGEAWLGAINLYDADRDKPERALWKWDGSLVRNFSCGFVAPSFDQKLADLIMHRNRRVAEYSAQDNLDTLNAVLARIAEVGGVTLYWT